MSEELTRMEETEHAEQREQAERAAQTEQVKSTGTNSIETGADSTVHSLTAISYAYGTFPREQFEQYKVLLHKKIFWLLVYKDPKTAEQYSYVNFNQYYSRLMQKLDGLNRLLSYPAEMIDIMSTLEAAYLETLSKRFNYSTYRRLILEAHALIDKMGVTETTENSDVVTDAPVSGTGGDAP